MTLLTLARVIAVVVSTGTLAFLFLNGSWRSDNLFLVPDLILCALLIIAAAIPGPRAEPVLIFAFGVSAGVFATSVSSYAIQGQLGAASLVGAITAGVLAVLLMRSRVASL